MNVVVSDDDVGNFDPYPEQNPPLGWIFMVLTFFEFLDLKRSRYRKPNIIKGQEHPIAERVDEPPLAVRKHLRLDVLNEGEPP